MKLLKAFAILLIILTAAACGGGGGTVNPITPSQGGDNDQSTLAITTFSATPSTGGSPLGVNFIATVTGGRLPYTYMWDFNNDGAFDFYINEVGSKTEQSYHLYYLRDSDSSAGISTYQAVVKVLDGDGTTRTSSAVTILVTSEPQFALDTSLTRIISDQVSGYDEFGNPIYMYLSGEPIYCRVFPDTTNPGTPPYRFQWDFNGDGRIDSTLQNPQYTFTLLEGESATYIITLTVKDSHDYTISREFPITVLKQAPSEPTGAPELLTNTSPPTLLDNSILISFDSSSDDPAEREPRLNASVAIDPDHPGIPPYSYFWDFTNDGIYDANTTSVSVPFYDADLKILINPYNTFGKASRTFTMVLHFIDGIGQTVHKEWSVRVVDRAYEPVVNPLITTSLVDLNGDGNFDTLGDGTYAEQARKLTTGSNADVVYRITAGGSTGIYRFMLDVVGDGVYAYDVPEGSPPVTDGELEWDPNYDGVYENVDLDADANTVDTDVQFAQSGETQVATITVHYPTAMVPGYKAVASKVVALDEAGLELASRSDEIPLSFVIRDAITFDATGEALKTRRDFGLAGVTVIDDRGSPDPVDDRFAERRVYCIGGMNGNVALRSVQLIKQDYDFGSQAWSPVISISDRLPLSTARGQLVAEPINGLATTTTATDIYAIGGFNSEEQTLSVVETLPSIDGDADDYPTMPWSTVGSIGNNNTQLRQMASIHGISLGGNAALIMMGGLQGDPPGEFVSGTGWIFVPGTGAWNSSIIASMPTPRYDFAMVMDAPSTSAIYLYIIGGRNNQGQSTRALERVNLLTGGWEILPDLKYSRAGCTAQIIRGIIYVYGGMNYPEDNSAPAYVAEAEVFNPETYVWSATISPDDSLGRAGANSVALPTFQNADGSVKDNDTIWVVGGESVNGLTDTAYQLYVEAVANLP